MCRMHRIVLPQLPGTPPEGGISNGQGSISTRKKLAYNFGAMKNDVTRSGQWYLWAKCHSYHDSIPITRCPSPPAPPFTGDGKLTWRGVPCPHCGVKADYEMGPADTPSSSLPGQRGLNPRCRLTPRSTSLEFPPAAAHTPAARLSGCTVCANLPKFFHTRTHFAQSWRHTMLA